MEQKRIVSIQIKILAISAAVFVLFTAAFIFGDFFQVGRFVQDDYLNNMAERLALIEISFFEESDLMNEAKLQSIAEKFAEKFPKYID